VARSTFANQNAQNTSWFGARSTFASQNIQKTSASEQFLKFRSGKMARRKSKCGKNNGFGPLFDIQMSKSGTPLCREASQNAQNTSASEQFLKFRCPKNGTPLWHEAHLQVKMRKNSVS